ncbi:response regulator receiver protein [Paraburkholderia phytofirmans OLGA172]|uniref:Response regulator receiver protein n=1 Tax=Paraburkholderia phytofirmans OLGA172 TaxID=1417228 RepID=A0A160FTA6_9BURK|nr:response regulator [Paraburkholderia phytofirmans]ANB76390.1 response regulator receiver protein [Paraburkholderia phytofirmans OLGA172]
MNSTTFVSIVDDDESVRLATASLVSSLGWQTRVFASAEEFLRSPQIGEASFLISDVRMPRMSGVEMHDELLKRGHAPPTIFLTAFPTAALQAKVHTNGVLAVLAKPIGAAAMAHWLSLALGPPGQTKV